MATRPTQRSIARDLEVSIATVSLALRDSPSISLEIRQLVQNYAKKVKYSPDAVMGQLLARMRQRDKPALQGLLACVSCCRSSPEWDRWACHTERLAGAEMRAAELGYRMDRFWAYEPGLTPKRLMSIFQARRIQGVFFPIIDAEMDIPQSFQPLIHAYPCATTFAFPQSIHHVMNNLFHSVQTASSELFTLGYRRIGLATSLHADARCGMQGQDGYVSISHRLFGHTGLNIFNLDDCTESLFVDWLKREKPDSVITHARDCLKWAQNAGYSVPGNLAMVHLDKSEVPDWATLDQQHPLIGAAAIDMIVDQIHRNNWAKPHEIKSIFIEPIWSPGRTVCQKRPK